MSYRSFIPLPPTPCGCRSRQHFALLRVLWTCLLGAEILGSDSSSVSSADRSPQRVCSPLQTGHSEICAVRSSLYLVFFLVVIKYILCTNKCVMVSSRRLNFTVLMRNLFLCLQLTHMDAQQMHPNNITYTQYRCLLGKF